MILTYNFQAHSRQPWLAWFMITYYIWYGWGRDTLLSAHDIGIIIWSKLYLYDDILKTLFSVQICLPLAVELRIFIRVCMFGFLVIFYAGLAYVKNNMLFRKINFKFRSNSGLNCKKSNNRLYNFGFKI